MAHFVIEFDRRRRQLLRVAAFEDAHGREATRLLNEIDEAKPRHVLSVLVQAESVEGLTGAHAEFFQSSRRRPCRGVRQDGQPCQAWAVRGDPFMVCVAHRSGGQQGALPLA